MTKILPINEDSLEYAKRLINQGEVVAFPTETVYGLGANALDTAAVNKIFEIKGRPNDNPIIVHVPNGYDISELVSDIPDYAKALSRAYLPGALTMVYKSKGVVSGAVSCGLNTVAIRVPSHKGAQQFLKYMEVPIAAPSANISKHVSPTSAEHVYADLKDKIEIILDGGVCAGGIESTVLDCTGKIPVILRSGLITREMIIKVAGNCDVYEFKEGGVARSPGMKYKHYSPMCKTALFDYNELGSALELYDRETAEGRKVAILCDAQTVKSLGGRNYLNLGITPEEMAANLYSKLREGERTVQVIIAVAPENRGGVMDGVMNRLTKACRS